MASATILDQLTELAGPGLLPGEQPVTAARVNYNGARATRHATMNSEIAALKASLDVDHDPDSIEIDPNTLVAFPAANQMALLVTDKRVIVWGLSLTGKPNKVVGTVPGEALAEVHRGEISFGPLVRVVMKSGAAVDLEVKKGDDAAALEAALQHLAASDGAVSQ